MPKVSFALFLLGVASLFAAVGTVSDALSVEQGQQPALFLSIVMSATCAVLWAYFGAMRMRKALLPMAALQVALYFVTARWFPRRPYTAPHEQIMHDLAMRDLAVMIFIILGYVLFVMFFRREGKRFFAVHTEMELAAEIQKELVPPISRTLTHFELYGISLPSGRVGGDLIDIVAQDGKFCAYLADIAGHGVPAGVLMSMVKSAVRMRIVSAGPADPELLPTLNSTIQPLTSPSAYLTFAYAAGADSRSLRFSLAAHLPLLHYVARSRSFVHVALENLPVGMFPTVAYQSGVLHCEPGDIVLMLTDGLTEIFNSSGQESGTTYIEDIITRSPARPLVDLATDIMRQAEFFGPITDDRSLLLLRCTC